MITKEKLFKYYRNCSFEELIKSGFKIDTNKNDLIQFYNSLDFIEKIDFSKIKNIADIGSGPGHQSLLFSQIGLDVTCIDFVKPLYSSLEHIVPLNIDLKEKFDAIWSSHCLEHIMNPIAELIKWHKILKDNGQLFLTVPEFGAVISTGHITNYSIPLLMYHLAISGFDCSEGCFDISGSQIRAKVKKQSKYLPYDSIITSLKQLADFGLFPKSTTIAINETSRIRSENIVLHFFDVTKKPVKNSHIFYSFVMNSLWK